MNHEISDASIGEKKGFRNIAYLSPLAVIALSFGYAVGWGSFVLPGTMFADRRPRGHDNRTSDRHCGDHGAGL